jgi:hypothetical protein
MMALEALFGMELDKIKNQKYGSEPNVLNGDYKFTDKTGKVYEIVQEYIKGEKKGAYGVFCDNKYVSHHKTYDEAKAKIMSLGKF